MSGREDLAGLVARLREVSANARNEFAGQWADAEYTGERPDLEPIAAELTVERVEEAADAIEALAAENARLASSEPACAADEYADILARAEAAEAALAVAEEALLFYADKAAWTQPPIRVLEGEFGPAYENEASQMQRDRGKFARAALAKIEALKGGAE